MRIDQSGAPDLGPIESEHVTGPEATDAGACAQPDADAAQGEAPVSRTPTSAPFGSLMSDLLKKTLDTTLPMPGEAPSIQQKLETMLAGLKLFQAIQSDPTGANEFLQNALFEHNDLLDGLKGFAQALGEGSLTGLVGTASTLASMLDGDTMREAEGRLSSLLPRAELSGRDGSQFGVGDQGRGRVTDSLGGTAEGSYRTFAGGRTSSQGSASIGLSGLQAQGRAEAMAGVEGELRGSYDSAFLQANGRLSADAKVYAEADGTVTASWDEGLRARGHAEVGARAQVEVEGDFRTAGFDVGGRRVDLNGHVEAQAEVSARAGVDADVAATIRPPRLVADLQAEAFAGAKAGVEGTVGIGDFASITGYAEAWAGAGAEAGITAGYDDGKLRFGFNLGAALEVGAGAGFMVELDVNALADSAMGLAGDVFDALTPFDEIAGLAGGLLDLVGGDDAPDYSGCEQLVPLFPPSIFPQATNRSGLDSAIQAIETALSLIAD